MSKFKGTQGKWEVFDQGIKTVADIRSDMICRIPTEWDDDSLNNWQANAKLIAAAPELLEFAMEMVKRYPNSEWITDQANKAINKAIN